MITIGDILIWPSIGLLIAAGSIYADALSTALIDDTYSYLEMTPLWKHLAGGLIIGCIILPLVWYIGIPWLKTVWPHIKKFWNYKLN